MRRKRWQEMETWWARFVGLARRAAGQQGDLGSDVVARGHPFAYEVKSEGLKPRSSFSWAFIREAMLQAQRNAERHSEEEGEEFLPAVVLIRLPGAGRAFDVYAEHAVVVDIATWRAILERTGWHGTTSKD